MLCANLSQGSGSLAYSNSLRMSFHGDGTAIIFLVSSEQQAVGGGAGVQFPTHSSSTVASLSISRVILRDEHRGYCGPHTGCGKLDEIEIAMTWFIKLNYNSVCYSFPKIFLNT